MLQGVEGTVLMPNHLCVVSPDVYILQLHQTCLPVGGFDPNIGRLYASVSSPKVILPAVVNPKR